MTPPPSRVADYWSLTKPEVNALIGVTTVVGFVLGHPAGVGLPDRATSLLLAHTVIGTLLVASGTATLNQWTERRFDALMRRTAMRAIAAGRIEPSRGLAFGLVLSVAGVLYLALAVNLLASVLAAATLGAYLFVYTPLKRTTPLCTVVGAIPGAAPTLIGWAAATGTLGLEAWVLFAIVFLWQFPHVMPIAWMYRQDYGRAGFAMLPDGDRGAAFMVRLLLWPSVLLLPLSLAPVLLGHAGPVYWVTAIVLGLWFVYRADCFAFERSNAMARRLLFASLAYLPLLFIAMVLDRQ